MVFLLAAAALMQSDIVYTAYPAFGDKEPDYYSDPRVLVVHDRSLIRELIVSCRDGGEGILIHEIITDSCVDSKNKTHGSLSAAIAGTCQ